MKRAWPIIGVEDVPLSAEWYMALLGARQTHPGGTTFDQVVDVAVNEAWMAQETES